MQLLKVNTAWFTKEIVKENVLHYLNKGLQSQYTLYSVQYQPYSFQFLGNAVGHWPWPPHPPPPTCSSWASGGLEVSRPIAAWFTHTHSKYTIPTQANCTKRGPSSFSPVNGQQCLVRSLPPGTDSCVKRYNKVFSTL
jgi:hypothetical protein